MQIKTVNKQEFIKAMQGIPDKIINIIFHDSPEITLKGRYTETKMQSRG